MMSTSHVSETVLHREESDSDFEPIIQRSLRPIPTLSPVEENVSKSHVSETVLKDWDCDSDFEHVFHSSTVPLPPPSVLHDALKRPTKQLSSSAQQLLGKQVPTNTKKNNLTALRALCKFICVYTNYSGSDILDHGRTFLFTDCFSRLMPTQNTEWSDNHLAHIRNVLIEYVANCKNERTGDDVMPTTIKNYILGIQRGMEMEWGYKLKLLTGPIFSCPKDGLMAVIDNKVRILQERGLHSQHHNVLTREDLLKLFNSPSLSRDSPSGFQNRLVFTVGILTAMRPTALATLKLSQFQKIRLGDDTVWKITGCVGSTSGSSKTAGGGWKAIGQSPTEVCIWNEDYADGSINFYKDIDEYMSIRESVAPTLDRFFLGIHGRATCRNKFFKGQAMGKNLFLRVVKHCCSDEGINGSGTKSWVTTHGLRGTLATLLFQAGHADSSVSLRTGHRDPRSLKSYQNLRGVEGLRQQQDLLQDFQSPIKKRKDSDSSDATIAQHPTLQPQTAPSAPQISRLFSDIHTIDRTTINININCATDGMSRATNTDSTLCSKTSKTGTSKGTD